jgi:hypothetical protein
MLFGATPGAILERLGHVFEGSFLYRYKIKKAVPLRGKIPPVVQAFCLFLSFLILPPAPSFHVTSGEILPCSGNHIRLFTAHFSARAIIIANHCSGILLDLLFFLGGNGHYLALQKENGSGGGTSVTPRIHLGAVAER